MKCPICNQPVHWQENPNRPFCSERCRMLDFGAWVNEEYTVPTEEAPLSEESSRSPDAGPNHPDAAS